MESLPSSAWRGDMVMATVAPDKVRPSIWIVATRSPREKASRKAACLDGKVQRRRLTIRLR